MTLDDSAVGSIGELVIATRGPAGPGEVLIRVRGGSETYIAWSEVPLARGTSVLVISARGARAVDVSEWDDPLAGLTARSDPTTASGGPPAPHTDSE